MKKKYFSDLFIENEKLFDENRIFLRNINSLDGIKMEEIKLDDYIKVIRIMVTNEEGSRLLEKPMGTYTTLEVKGLESEDGKDIEKRLALALSLELKKITKGKTTLVIGIGNEDVIPDSLGPKVVKQLHITGDIFPRFKEKVYGLITGVEGVTGMETWKQVQAISKMIRPDTVILIDSLSARNIDRIGTTIQISTEGLAPGGGTEAKKKVIDEKLLGCKVVSIGIPTVINYRNLVIEAMEEPDIDEEKVNSYLEKEERKIIVTSTDVDIQVNKFSKIIGNGINITLIPDIYF